MVKSIRSIGFTNIISGDTTASLITVNRSGTYVHTNIVIKKLFFYLFLNNLHSTKTYVYVLIDSCVVMAVHWYMAESLG